MSTPARIVLLPGRDASARRRHPWVLSGAVARVEGEPADGDLVRVLASDGEVLGHGHFAPASQLRVRLLEFGKESRGEALVAERLRAAREAHPLLAGTNALRLVNAEGDGLPGLVVDRFDDVLVVRAGSMAWLRRSDAVGQVLRDLTNARVGLARPDVAALRREGAQAEPRTLWGEPPSEPVLVRERGREYFADVAHGQKTGFYLDQREARDLVQALAAGKRVLDLFSYTGGMAVAALQGGAVHVALVDSSADALALAQRNLVHAGARERAEIVEADGFEFARKQARGFELAIADPPPLARRKADVQRAARAYKDMLLHLLRHAPPGGRVLAFSCSHHVGPDLFRKIAFGAALDAGRDARITAELGAPPDHPVSLYHPEGHYLTGLLLELAP
ncbi:MAG: class I SAM-dependent rRNA methyltransferase [Deltaproteobacteria bacterium]|nr:class I SAM-dependent rRNA methyltransferase [Deltaproteobacteria bacterium]